MFSSFFKKWSFHWAQWLTSVIPALWEAKAGNHKFKTRLINMGWSFAILPRLVSNFWAQVIQLPRPPKDLGFQDLSPHASSQTAVEKRKLKQEDKAIEMCEGKRRKRRQEARFGTPAASLDEAAGELWAHPQARPAPWRPRSAGSTGLAGPEWAVAPRCALASPLSRRWRNTLPVPIGPLHQTAAQGRPVTSPRPPGVSRAALDWPRHPGEDAEPRLLRAPGGRGYLRWGPRPRPTSHSA
ncbi:hypothetical protein AAY473_009306 [Plecturocebus cupreus]